MALDLREFEFGVVWIHLLDLISRRRTQYFNDLNQLIDARISRKDRLAQKQFGQHTARTPDIYKVKRHR